jgi:hypothetical protein
MSQSTVILSVNQSLLNLLKQKIRGFDITPINFSFLSPDKISDNFHGINLFLYQVKESPFFNVQGNHSNTSSLPPLSLSLFYLVTVYGGESKENDGGDYQDKVNDYQESYYRLLGETIRVFYEYQVVPEECLVGDLKHAPEQIKIMPNSLELEELSKIWTNFNKPFRLSVAYEVSVVQIDPLQIKKKAKPVTQLLLNVTPKERTPIIHLMYKGFLSEEKFQVTFKGEHLKGHDAQVIIGKKWPFVTVEEGKKFIEVDVESDKVSEAFVLIMVKGITEDDEFTCVIPMKNLELSPDSVINFYPIQVNISELFQKTFLLEVPSLKTEE